MDPPRKTPDMSPVDRDGDKSESIFQPTEKTDEEKTKRLTSAEETAKPTISQSPQEAGKKIGQNEDENRKNSDQETQRPPVEELATDTETPSVDECVKELEGSKCDEVKDSLSNNIEVQIKTTNNSDDNSSVAIENSSSSIDTKSDDKNIISSESKLDTSNCDEDKTRSQLSEMKGEDNKTSSLSDVEDVEERATSKLSDMKSEQEKTPSQISERKCDQENTPSSSSEGKCDGEKTPSQSSALGCDEDKTPSSSSEGKFDEEKTPSQSSALDCDEEKTPSSSSEGKFDEEKTPSLSSEGKCDKEKIPSPSSERKCDDEETSNPSPERKCDVEKNPSPPFERECDEEENTLSPSSVGKCDEEKTSSPSSERESDEKKTPSQSSEREYDERKTPRQSSEGKCDEEKTLSTLSEGKWDEEKTPSQSSERECDEEKIPSQSGSEFHEKKTPSQLSEGKCDEEKTLSTLSEGKCDDKKTPSQSERECDEEKTTSQSSERECDEEKTLSTLSEGKCDEEKTLNTLSEGKCDDKKTPNQSTGSECHEKKTPSQSSEMECDDKKNPSQSTERECDEKKTPSQSTGSECHEKKTPSQSSEMECDDKKNPSQSTERECDEKKTPSQSSEMECDDKKNPSQSSERECDEKKTLSQSSERECDEKKILSQSSEMECDDKKTPSQSSERECDKKKILSQSSEMECDDNKTPSQSSEIKCGEEDTLSQSFEKTGKEEITLSQSKPLAEPEICDSKQDSCSEKVCPVVSKSCEKSHTPSFEDKEPEEQNQTERSSDVKVKSAFELVGAEEGDENKDTSWENGDLVIDEESQESTADLEKGKDADITGNNCQLLEESSKREVDLVKSEQMSKIDGDDSCTNKDNVVVNPVESTFSADIQCTLDEKPEKHDLLIVDNSDSKNEACWNKEIVNSEESSQNEVDESSKFDCKMSPTKIDVSISSECAEDKNKEENGVSNNLTEPRANLLNEKLDQNNLIEVPQNANEETSNTVASVSKCDEDVRPVENDILTLKEQQMSIQNELCTNTGSNVIPIVNSSNETTSIEKSDDSILICNESMDMEDDISNPTESRADNQNSKLDCVASLDVANRETAPSNLKDKKDVDNNSDVSTSKSDESDLSGTKNGNSCQQPTHSDDIQSKLDNKLESSNNVDNTNEKTTKGEIEETVNCRIDQQNANGDSGKTDAPLEDLKVKHNILCDSLPSAGIQNTLPEKLEMYDLAVTSKHSEIPSCVGGNDEILSRSVLSNAKDSTSQSNDDFKGKKAATPMHSTGIQITINEKSDPNLPSGVYSVARTASAVEGKRKSVSCGTNTQNSSQVCGGSMVSRNIPILPRPSTSKCVGTLNIDKKEAMRLMKKRPATISVSKVSKGTTTDAPDRTHKPLFLSKMDVQRISEMKPTNPQLINHDQLHKKLCIIKTSKSGCQVETLTQVSEKARPRKVSIDCQVDESELLPIKSYHLIPKGSNAASVAKTTAQETTQSFENESAVKGSVATNTSNSKNQIFVTVRGQFAEQPVASSIPVQIDNSAPNSLENQERISEAVKFFFQGATNLDRFFAPNARQQNTGETAKICTNMTSSVKEHSGPWPASFELDKNVTSISSSKKKTDKRKFTPILPKPASGGVVLDQSKKLDGDLSIANDKMQTTTLLTSCGEVKIAVPTYALEGGSKLQQVVDKLYLAQESSMPDDNTLQALLKHGSESGEMSSVGQQTKMNKNDLTSNIQGHLAKDMLSRLKLPSNLTVIPQTVKKQKLNVGSLAQTIQPHNENDEGSVFARLKKLGTVIEVECDGNEKLASPGSGTGLLVSRSETSSPSATPNVATGNQPDYAQCLRVLDNLTQAGQILASIKKVKPKTAAKSKSLLKPLPNLKKIEAPAQLTNKQNLQRRSSLPSDARSSPVLSEATIRSEISAEVASRVPVNLNENEHCLKIASNPELTIIHKKLTQGLPAAQTPAPTTAGASAIECPSLPKILQFEQQLNCPPTISITTEESGGRKETKESINTFVFQLDVSQVKEKSEGERVLNCDICSAEYPKVASLKRHYLRKHINARYISNQDKQNYLAPSKNKNGAQSSSQKSAGTEEDESMKGLYKCSTCRKCFDEKNDLKNHLFEQHILGSVEFKTFDCSKCSNTFDNIKEFVAHRKICSQKPTPPPPPISHQFCLYCEQSFVNIAARNKHHNKSHHFKKKYQQCFICNSDKYRDKSSLFKHMCTEHKANYFGCEHCHFRFGTKADLDRHNHVKHGLKKASKKMKKSITSEVEEAKLLENNKSEDSQLPSENSKLENESTEVVEKVVESLPKLTKNCNTEINSKYELAKKLVRVGPQNVTDSEMSDKNVTVVDKPAEMKEKNESKTKAGNKKKPEPKATTNNDSKSKSETKDVSETGKVEGKIEEKVVESKTKVEEKVVESKTKVEEKVVESNTKVVEKVVESKTKVVEKVVESKTKVVEKVVESKTKVVEKVVESKTKVEDKKKNIVSNNTNQCNVCGKAFGSAVNLSRHNRLAHGFHPRRKLPTKKVKIGPKLNVFTSEAADESEHKVLHNVYGSAAASAGNENNPNSFTRNVKENLLHHLDGKLDSQEVMEHDLKSQRAGATQKRRLSFSASFSSSEHSLENAVKESQDTKDGLLPISPKSSIEKYNFPKNYDGCGGLTSYFKDMSHLDLFTQKAMRFTPQACFENGGASVGEFSDVPTCLELMKTDRSELEDEPFEEVEFSGEWTRPRRYICAVCNFCTGELWEIEDHKLALHPNVWCPHHEVLVEEADSWQVVYRKRMLKAKGVLGGKANLAYMAALAAAQYRCSKCNKMSASQSDFHRHMLDCGGDTTWAITMLGVSSPGSRRNRKWRPFGSRRRRQQGRRGLKRNIPNTPAKQPGSKIRTKPGDMETIQKMIANLPAKRVSRRVFGDDNEVKTRSQGTISSGSIYSTPFTYQFNNKTALAKKQAAKLLKPKIVSNGNLYESPKKDENKSKLSVEVSEKPPTSKSSPGKESSVESPTRKKLKSPDKNKPETCEKRSDVNIQGKNPLKRDNSKVDKSVSPGKEDSSGEHDVKKKQKLRHNVFTVKEGSVAKNVEKSGTSGKNKLQIVDSSASGHSTVVEANKNEMSSLPTSVAAVNRSKTANKSGKQDTDKQKRSSDDSRKSQDDYKKRMCIDGNLIMCSGCAAQFDNSSACQRHMKKCSYCTGKAAGGLTCSQCNTSFTSESLKQEHVCDSLPDDRAMPELSPEEPFPDQAPAAAEDIPVLSPEEIGKNKADDSISRKGSRLTRSESKSSILEAVKKEKISSEPSVTTRNSRSGLRQKSELNKSLQDLNNLDLNNKRVLRYRSITNLSSPDDEDDDLKTAAPKSDEPDVSGKNQQKQTAAKTSGRKRPLEEDDVKTDNDKDNAESSVRRESRRGQFINKSQSSSELDSDKNESKSNESRRKSMRLSVSTENTSCEKKPNESEKSERSLRKSVGNEESQIKTEINNEGKVSLDFLKETSVTGERQGKRFLCEVCDKVIMEIYLRKHVESGKHSRNVEMRNDFDNLFPDPEKFIMSCSTCNRSFSSPFMSYKHQLHYHEDSLMELIESSMIEPLKKEIKEEGGNDDVDDDDDDDDDDVSLIETKMKLMSKKASEEKRNSLADNSTANTSQTDCNKLKQNSVKGGGSSMNTEKTSRGKSAKMTMGNVNETIHLVSKKMDESTASSFNDVTIKFEDTSTDNIERRTLRARRNSLPNDPTAKFEDKTEFPSSREGRRSSLRVDSSVGKAKEIVECKNSSESVVFSSPSNEAAVKCEDSTVVNTDLQLKGRRSLSTSENNDNASSVTKTVTEMNTSPSMNDATEKCVDAPVVATASSKQKIADDAITEKEKAIVHETTEFSQDGKTMVYCCICDRAVGKSAYRKHSNSLFHKQNTKFKKEFNEKYADSTVTTCKACHMDFAHSYLCFKHSMEVHPEAVVLMFDPTTSQLSSNETTAHDSNKKMLPPKDHTIGNHMIDPKKTLITILTPKEVVQTTMFEFFKKAPTSPQEATENTTYDVTQKTKIACPKKSIPISSSNAVKPNTLPDLHKKNAEAVTKTISDSDLSNHTPILPPNLVKMSSPFDFINETLSPILSYREVTQSTSQANVNKRRIVVNPTLSTKDVKKNNAKFDSNQKTSSMKEVSTVDSSKKSNTPLLCSKDDEIEKSSIPKASPNENAPNTQSVLTQKIGGLTPVSAFKELSIEIYPDDEDTASVTKGEENLLTILKNVPTSEVNPVEVKSVGVKPFNTLFCATCHKRVKIESLLKHSASSSHKVNYDQNNFDYEVPVDCDRCQILESFPFACRLHQKSVLKSKKRRRKISDDECSKRLVKSLLDKMSRKKLNKLKKRQKLRQSEKLAETKINRLKKMKINNWQVSVVKNEKCETQTSSTLTPQQVEESESRNASEFDCLLCDKQFNSARLLVQHQTTTMHKLNESRHALQSTQLPKPPLQAASRQIPPSASTPPQQEADRLFGYFEQPPAFTNANLNNSDQDLTQTAGEAILAYGWQDHDWSTVRSMSGWDNQSVAGSSSSGMADTNMSAFWETDVTSSFIGGRSSLGSILDSVNKILTDPDVSTDPTYNLTELQSEVGAYHDDMSMFQHLGERSNFFQDMGMRTETSASNSWSFQDNWSYPPSVEDGSAILMDLDNQPAPPSAAFEPADEKKATTTDTNLDSSMSIASADESKEQLHKRLKLSADVGQDKNSGLKAERSKRKHSVDSEGGGSSSRSRAKRPPVDYESRETICPSCGKHFLGLTAVQVHMSTCSNIGAKSGGTLTWLKRRALLNTPCSFDSSLVCHVCKEILNSPESLRSHVSEDHPKSKPVNRNETPKSNNDDPINKEGAEKFKSKMSVALSTLLDKALNNLLGVKNQEPELNSGAIQLLGKLCAVRRKSQQKMKSSAAPAASTAGGSSSSTTTSAAAAGAAAVEGGSGSSQQTNYILEGGNLNLKTKARLRSLIASDHLPKLPWLANATGGAGGSSSSTSTSQTLYKPVSLPSPNTLVDHLAMMLADGKPTDNSYACPVCSEKFAIPSARNNHMYQVHQDISKRQRTNLASNAEERSSSQSNPSEKDWRGIASSSCDSDFGTENGVGESAIRPICSDCGLSFPNLHDILIHRREDHNNDLPVSENIVDSTSGDENRGVSKKTKKTGGGCKGGGEKTLPGLEPIERLRKRPVRKASSQEEQVVERVETIVKDECEDEDEEDGSAQKKRSKFAPKQRMSVLAPDDVRVKAEAALRELSLQKGYTHKGEFVGGPCKYGSYRYSQQNISSSDVTDNAAMVKARFASIVDKKWKMSGSEGFELAAKTARHSLDGRESPEDATTPAFGSELEHDGKIKTEGDFPDLPPE